MRSFFAIVLDKNYLRYFMETCDNQDFSNDGLNDTSPSFSEELKLGELTFKQVFEIKQFVKMLGECGSTGYAMSQYVYEVLKKEEAKDCFTAMINISTMEAEIREQEIAFESRRQVLELEETISNLTIENMQYKQELAELDAHHRSVVLELKEKALDYQAKCLDFKAAVVALRGQNQELKTLLEKTVADLEKGAGIYDNPEAKLSG